MLLLNISFRILHFTIFCAYKRRPFYFVPELSGSSTSGYAYTRLVVFFFSRNKKCNRYVWIARRAGGENVCGGGGVLCVFKNVKKIRFGRLINVVVVLCPRARDGWRVDCCVNFILCFLVFIGENSIRLVSLRSLLNGEFLRRVYKERKGHTHFRS